MITNSRWQVVTDFEIDPRLISLFCPLNKKNAPCAVHIELERIQGELDKELQKKSLVQIITECAKDQEKKKASKAKAKKKN